MGRPGISKLIALAVAACLVGVAGDGKSALAQVEAKSSVALPLMHGALPLTPFYSTPDPLPAGHPGDLIRSEPFDQYDVPMGVSAIRILYRSVSARGEDVAASGVVLVPDGNAPANGWPVIAWAHGFFSTARPCAPSLMRTLHTGSFLSMYLNLGYAVVATDYVGLGTAYRNASIDMQSNAIDVIYSVRAARRAVAQLGSKWIALGDADGGTAALAIAEMEESMHDAGYLGSVGVSGALDLKTQINQVSQRPWQDGIAFLAYGIKTVYPEFQPKDILTPKGLDRYRAVTEVCPVPASGPASAASEMLKSGWQTNRLVDGFVGRNTLGLKPAYAPLLIVSAEDPKANDSTAARVVARMCAQGDHIAFETYPGLDSARLLGTSVPAQISWIKARFAQRSTPNNCR
jgi:hypothetical protein